jgi:hypothetical protein
MQPAPKAQGFFEGAGSAISQGWSSGLRANEAFAKTLAKDYQGVEQLAKEHQAAQLQKPQALQSFNAAMDQNFQTYDPNLFTRAMGGLFGEGTEQTIEALGDVGGAMWDNPEGALQATLEQTAQSAPAMAATLGGYWAGGKAGGATGAAVGSVIPVAGTIAGAKAGAAIGAIGGGYAGAYAGNTALEGGIKALETGADGYTPEEAEGAVQYGSDKGKILALVDTLSLGLGSLITRGLTRPALEAAARAEARVLARGGANFTSRESLEQSLRADPGLYKAAKLEGEASAKAATTAGMQAKAFGANLGVQMAAEGGGEGGPSLEELEQLVDQMPEEAKQALGQLIARNTPVREAIGMVVKELQGASNEQPA